MNKLETSKTNISEKAKKVARVGLAVGAVAMVVKEAPASANQTHKAGKSHEQKYSVTQADNIVEGLIAQGRPVSIYNGTLFRKEENHTGGVQADPNTTGGQPYLYDSHDKRSFISYPLIINGDHPEKPYDNPELTSKTLVGSVSKEEGRLRVRLHHFNSKDMRMVPDDTSSEPTRMVWFLKDPLGQIDINVAMTSNDGRTIHGGPFVSEKTNQPVLVGFENGLKPAQ